MGEPITIKGIDYQCGKLDAMKQLHVARRVLPIMGSLVSLMKAGTEIGLDVALPAMSEQLASMPDADIDFIVKGCLAVVSRKTETGWAPVLAANGMPMFQEDMDLMVILQLVGAVIQENIGGFFGGNGLTLSPGGSQA